MSANEEQQTTDVPTEPMEVEPTPATEAPNASEAPNAPESTSSTPATSAPSTPIVYSESNPMKLPVEQPEQFILGLDLGNEKAIVSIAKQGEITHTPYPLHNKLGDLFHLNWISYGDKRVIGTDAGSQLVLNTDGTVYDIKSLVRKEKNDETDKHYRFKLNTKQEGDKTVYDSVDFDGKSFLSEEDTKNLKFHQILASLISNFTSFAHSDMLYWQFRQKILTQRVPKGIPIEKTEATGLDVKKVVFAVPANYSASQRAVIMDAAAIAGVQVVGLVDEGVSSILAYCLLRKNEFKQMGTDYTETVLVVDLGQQYLHVAVADVAYLSVKVLASTSVSLGTNALRQAVTNSVKSQLCEKHHVSTLSPKTLAKLDRAVEKAIKVLSTSVQAHVEIDNFTSESDASQIITRVEFEEICHPLFNEIREVITNTLSAANVIPTSSLKVEIVGGGCRIPAVQNAIKVATTADLHYNLDSNNSVSIGAAVYGSLVVFDEAYDIENETKFVLEWKPAVSNEEIEQHRISKEELEAAIEYEKELANKDEEFAKTEELKNSIEQFLYQYEDKTNSNAGKIPAEEVTAIQALLEEEKQWFLYSGESDSVSFAELSERFAQFKSKLYETGPKLHEVLEEQEKQKKKEEEEAAEAEKNRANVYRDKVKHPKTPQEKLDAAKARKDQGNKFFADVNYEHASTRYLQAINLLAEIPGEKFTEEIVQIRLSCYLNLAMCYINLKKYQLAIENCNLALKIEDNNAKGLFRRGKALYLSKKYEDAKADFQAVVKADPANTAAVKQAALCEKNIKLQQQKEKQMYAKMFG